jgi:hypothetical protein
MSKMSSNVNGVVFNSGNFLNIPFAPNPLIPLILSELSRKESSLYTNTLIAINKVWTAKAESPMGQPKMMNKGGMAMWYDATFVVTFGNVSNAGTSKIKAIKGGKQVEWGKRTNLQIDKNHVNGIAARGKIVMTSHGFIEDTDKDKNAYKKAHADEWSKILGGGTFTIVEDEEDATPVLYDVQDL